VFEVRSLLRPAEDRERPETRGEPSVKNVLILLECKLRITGELLGALCRFLNCTANNPVLAVRILRI
jgi:hypothetical protein